MIRKLYILLVLIIVFTLYTFSYIPFWEMPDYENPIRLQMYMSEFNLFSGSLLLEFKEKIGLTPKQTQKIENLMLVYKEFLIKQNADVKIQELRMTAAIKAKAVNRKQVAAGLKTIGNMKGDSMVRFLNYLLDLRQILTPEQLEKIKKIRDVMKEKFEKERKNRRSRSERSTIKKKSEQPVPFDFLL